MAERIKGPEEYARYLASLDKDSRNAALKADTPENRAMDSILNRVREAGSTFIGDYGRTSSRADTS